MDTSKIEHLKEKRKNLQEKIKQKELCKPISEIIKYLELNDFEYRIYYKAQNLNWIANNLKIRKKDGYYGIHGDFQIDVDDNSIINHRNIKSENAFLESKLIMNFINESATDSNFIVCSLGSFAEVEISKEIFLTQPSVFFINNDTWVIDNKKSIVIEKISAQRIIRFINIENREHPILRLKTSV